mgnify:CR=1 FL=1
MFVSVGAILNLRRMLGWDNQSLALQEGSKLRDVLKSIKIPGKGSAFEYMVDKEKYRQKKPVRMRQDREYQQQEEFSAYNNLQGQ